MLRNLKKQKIYLKRFSAMFLCLCLLIGLFPLGVIAAENIDISITKQPKIDIVLATGQTDKTKLDMTNFETDLRNALKGLGVDETEISKIETVETAEGGFDISAVSASEIINSWAKWPNPNNFTVNGTSLQSNGSNQGFTLEEECNSTKLIMEGDLQAHSASLDHASGFVVKWNRVNDTAIFVGAGNTSTIICEVSGVSKMWRNSMGPLLTTSGADYSNPSVGYSIKVIGRIPYANANRYRHTKLTLEGDNYTLNSDGLQITGTINANDSGFNGVYCSCTGWINNLNMEFEVIIKKSFADVLTMPSWNDKSIRALININDYVEEDFSNNDKLASILSRCANEQISYVSWGPSSTQSANQNFIALNGNRGKYIQIENKSTYSSAVQQTAVYLKSLLDAQRYQGNEFVLMNQDINLNVTPVSYKYNTQTTDYPSGRWLIKHDNSVFTNPNGQYINSGAYRPNLDATSFDKVGKYEIFFEQDPIKTIYIHRIPTAAFTLSVVNNIPQVRGISQDLDSNDNSKGLGPGIKAEKWSYKLSTATSWINGIPSIIEAGKSYVIQLEVQDYQDQWSEPVTKYISGSSSYVNPVADFNFSNPQISKYSTVSLTDASYDPKNSAIVQYKWSVVKDGTTKIFTDTTYSSFSYPSVNFQSYGKGSYAYTLTVKNAAGLTSDSYTKYLTVVDDTQAPEIEINPLPNANWVNSGYNVSIKISDTDSKLRSLSYSLTNNATTPGSYTNNLTLTNQTTNTQNVAINGEGQWYLHVKGMDMANNTVTLYRGPYKIDTQKPSINSHTITDLPTTVPVKTRSVVIDDHVTNKQVEISVNATDILPGSGVNKVEYKLAGQTVFSEASNKGSDTYAFRIETSYTGDITIRATDNTGNISEDYVIKGVVLVNSPPIINISNNSDWQNSSPLSIPVEIIDESGLAPISVATFKTSETTPQAGNLRKQDATHYFVDLNNEGVYAFEVTAKNVAGTEVYKKSEVVKIDKTKPLINRHVITELDELIDPISPFFYRNQYTNKKVRIEFDITDNLSGFNHMKYKLPGDADYIDLEPGETTFIIDKDMLGTISIFVDDVAGNISNEYTITDLIIDSKKPNVSIGNVPDWTNQDIIVDINVNDDIGLDSINWFTTESTDKETAQGATINLADWNGRGQIRLINEGVYTLLVAARDLAGNTTSVESKIIKIDKTKPEITKFEYYLPQPATLELPLPEIPVVPEVLPEEIPPEVTPLPEPLPEEPTAPPEDVPMVPDDSVPPETTPPVQPSTPPTENDNTATPSPTEPSNEIKPEDDKDIINDVEDIVLHDIALASLPENIFGTDILVQIFPRDIMGEAQSGISTVEYALSPDAWIELPADINGDYIFSLTENFNGTIYARCTDVAGNISDVYSEAVILDKDSPNPTLIIHSSDIWNVVPGVIDIAVQDANGLASVYFTLECTEGNGSSDAYELLNSEAPTNFNTEIEIPEDGIYTITVVAEDIAGNSTTRTANIKVDRTAPDINNVTFSVVDDDNVVIEPGNITNKKLLVTVDTSDALSKFEHLEYLTLDSDSWKPVAQGETSFYLTTAYKGNIKLRAFDYAGNASSIYISEEVVIEKEGPDLEVSNNSEWSPEDVVLTIHSEDILSGISKITYSYTLPDGTARNGEIPITDVDRTDTTFIATEHGSYPITFTAYDKAGNSTSVTRTVRIDKTPSLKAPQINSNEYVTGAWNSEKVELSAFYNTEDIPLSGISKYQYKEVGTETWIDGGVVLDEFMNKEFTFRAITTVGLISEETLPFNVKIDKNKPVIKENAIKDNSKFNSPIKITVEVIEEESGLNYIEYSIDKETWTRIEGNIIDLGSQYSGNVYIKAVDVCGNVSDIYEIKNLTIDFDRPTLKLISSLNTKDVIELEADEIVYKGNKGYIRIMNPKDESYMAPVAELFITNNRIKVDGTKIYVNVAGIIDGRKEYRIEVDEGFVKDMAGNLSYAMEASTLNTSSSKWPSMIGVTVKDVESNNVYTGVLDSDTNEYNVIIPKHLIGDVILTPKWDLKVNEIGAESKDVIIKEVTPINAKFTIDDDYNFPIQIQVMALSTKVNVNIYRGDIDVRFESDNVLNADISKDDIFRAIDFKGMLKDDASFEVVVSLNYDNSFEEEKKMAEERLKNIQNLEGLSDPIDINVKYYRIKDGVKEEPVYISELQNPLKITVDLPSKFSNKDAYNVIRIHDGKLSVLPATRSGSKLTFQSDKFSVYFIAVGDEIEYYVPPVVKRDWNEDMPIDTWCIVPALIDNDKVIARFSFIDKDNYMEFLKPVAGNYHLITNHKDFNDMVYNWNYEAVHALAARNIISGYTDGTFRPNNNITRAEFVSMISRLENLPLNNYNSSSFRDIKGDEWFAKNVEAIHDIGLVDGIGNGNFAPNRPVTRQEMAKILYNYLKYKGKDNLYADMAGKSFYDNTEISTWAIDGVRILSSLGIINGYTDSTFGPHKYATRAEASKMLWEEMKYIVEKSKDNHLITSYSEVNGDSKK